MDVKRSYINYRSSDYMIEMEQQSTSNPPVMQRQHTGIVKDTRGEGMVEIALAAHLQQGRRPDLRLWSNGETARRKKSWR
mgnify:FL=1